MLNHKTRLEQMRRHLKEASLGQPSRSRRGRRSGTEQLESRVLLAATPIGTEFRVNTAVTNTQTFSSVATDADGDFVVAWHSNQDGLSFDVYAQRYSAAGVPQGEEFRVNTATANTQSYPSVAMDADGDFVVSWQSDLQDGSGYGVYAQRYNAAGVTQGDEFRVSTTVSNSQQFSSVAMDVDGDFVVAWESYGQEGLYGAFGIYAQRYNSAGLRQGGEFRVNSATDGAQLTPSVAIDASGDFIVAWQSDVQDGSSFGIYAQRYNGLGVLQGSEFRVNTTTVNSQTAPSVAMDADGDYVVTWQSNGQDGSLQGIYAQRYNAAGVIHGAEFRVNTTTANNQTQPSVAMDANGDFVVAWNSNLQDGSVDGVYSQRYTSAGAALGGEFRVNTATASIQASPSVAMEADGDYVVTWQSYLQDGSLYGVYAQRYDESTSTSGPIVTEVRVLDRQITPGGRMSTTFDTLTVVFSEDLNVVDGTSGANSATNLANWQLTQDGVNVSSLITNVSFDFNEQTNKYEAVLTFAASLTAGTFQLTALATIQDLTGNTLDGDLNGTPGGNYTHSFAIANLQSAGGEVRVNTTTTNNQLDPSVAMDADGDYVVVWQSNHGATDDIYAQRYNAAGTAQGGEVLVNSTTTNNQRAPSVAMDADGDYVVVWQSNHGATYDVYARRYNAAGVAQGNEFLVNSTTADDQGSPSVAMDADGDFVVTWESYLQESSGNGIYAQRYNAGGAAQGGEFLVNTTTANDQTAPSVAMDADGDFVVAWQSNLQDGSDYGIYAQRYRLDAPVQLTTGVLSLTGTNFGNVMDVQLVTPPVGSVAYLNVVRDGVIYTIDPTKVTNILMNGLGGDDRLTVGATVTRRATLNGGGGNDTLIGGAGNDILNGGTGNDLYIFDTDLASGSDVIAEVSGIDTLDFSATTLNALALNLGLTTTQAINANLSLTLSTGNSIENIIGGALNDTLTGNVLNNSLTGGSGDDTMTGGAGNDRYLFDTDLVLGADTINEASGGIDTLDFGATTTRAVNINLGFATVQTVTTANLTLVLSAVNTIENVVGGMFGNTLVGNSLNNVLTGGAGADLYVFNANTALGSDTIFESGSGIDTLSFSGTTTQPVAVNLGIATAQVVNTNLTLNLTSAITMENVIGGSMGDTLIGNTLANSLTGGAGTDSLTGGAGDDTYLFNANSALGTDTINEAGGGIDTLNFSGTTTQVVAVNLATVGPQVLNANLALNLLSATTMENVIGGSPGRHSDRQHAGQHPDRGSRR